jgi:hypothetical protein
MKNLCLFSALGFLASSLLIGMPFPMAPIPKVPFEKTIEKGHHRGPKGPRGHRGKRGHKGMAGTTGATGGSSNTLPVSYLSLSFVGPPVNICPLYQTLPVILPLGIIDIPNEPGFLRYIDPNPSNPTADRYIEVLSGGGGIYYIQFSLFAQTSNYIAQQQVLLEIQPQIDYGAGWSDLAPFNVFQTVFTPAGVGGVNFYTSAGTSQGVIMLTEGSRLRAVILQATDLLTIGLNSSANITSRDVGITLIRIDSIH